MEPAVEQACAGLSELCSEVPSVPCFACGDCCVSPTCTLAEFIMLARHVAERMPPGSLDAFLLKPAENHPGYEGNLRCRSQDPISRRCLVHEGRTMACRLFGHGVIDTLKISGLENCRKMDPGTVKSVAADKLTEWLSRLTGINRSLVPSYYTEPYWIMGLNLECWLAVYFDPLLDDGAWGVMKRLLRANLDFSRFEARFQDRTGLKDKADRIMLLYELIRSGVRDRSLPLIKDIRESYPLTGTYYLEELGRLEKLVVSY